MISLDIHNLSILTRRAIMTNKVNQEMIIAALSKVKVRDGNSNLVSSGLLSEIVIHGGKVYFSITVSPDKVDAFADIRAQAISLVQELDGVDHVSVTLTADHDAGQAPRSRVMPGAAPNAKRQTGDTNNKLGIPGVKHIIAVASGKGGVGKSTTSVNLAMAFQANGLKTGILDADIYGPSMPRLLGITGKPHLNDQDKLIPMQSYGVKVMSMGFIVNEDEPMIWRGPMVISALTQMMNDVVWGELDVLVVDMPPGTGDVQLTMAQKVPVSGSIIVSTPQDLALLDARKGLNMFRKVEVPVLGIIENMSYFMCPNCGERSDIFGHGGARKEAERLNIPFLGEVPLHMDIREKSDQGEPVVVSSPQSDYAKIYKSVASQAWDYLLSHHENAQGQMPEIIFET